MPNLLQLRDGVIIESFKSDVQFVTWIKRCQIKDKYP